MRVDFIRECPIVNTPRVAQVAGMFDVFSSSSPFVPSFGMPGAARRIRHYGLFANGGRAENIARARQLLNVPAPQNPPSDLDSTGDGEPQALSHPCPCCGGRMIIIEIFERVCAPRYRPTVPNRLDSS